MLLGGCAVCNVGFRAKLRVDSACLFAYGVLVVLPGLVCLVTLVVCLLVLVGCAVRALVFSCCLEIGLIMISFVLDLLVWLLYG